MVNSLYKNGFKNDVISIIYCGREARASIVKIDWVQFVF